MVVTVDVAVVPLVVVTPLVAVVVTPVTLTRSRICTSDHGCNCRAILFTCYSVCRWTWWSISRPASDGQGRKADERRGIRLCGERRGHRNRHRYGALSNSDSTGLNCWDGCGAQHWRRSSRTMLA